MYVPGTILVKKKQRPAEVVPGPDKKIVNPETNEVTYEKTTIEKPFPYNRVLVVGPSFITHPAQSGAAWEGAAAAGVILQSAGEAFGATLDEPLGKIQDLYKVESVPEEFVEVAKIRVRDAYTAASGPTPEEIFKQEAPGQAPKKGEPRGRTPHVSPLEENRKPTTASPLD